LHVRKSSHALSQGSLRIVEALNPSVLAFVREVEVDQPHGTVDSVLCVFSFAHTPVSVRLELGDAYAGRGLRDLFGGAEFPSLSSDGAVVLTLGAQDFYWLATF